MHCDVHVAVENRRRRRCIGLYRENTIAVRVIDRSAYDAHRQRKNLSYLRNGCCIYYLRAPGSAHLYQRSIKKIESYLPACNVFGGVWRSLA